MKINLSGDSDVQTDTDKLDICSEYEKATEKMGKRGERAAR